MLTFKQFITEDINTMYHFTLKSKAWDIVESTGLSPKKGKGDSSYGNEARIYLFPKEAINRKDIGDWVREKFGHKSGDFTKDPKVALLKVDTSKVTVKKANLDEYYTNDSIPKEDIKIQDEDYIY